MHQIQHGEYEERGVLPVQGNEEEEDLIPVDKIEAVEGGGVIRSGGGPEVFRILCSTSGARSKPEGQTASLEHALRRGCQGRFMQG